MRVTDTQKKGGDLFVHAVTVAEGTVKVGDPLLLEVDHARRGAIRANHSATHLLHEALRQVLGDHVAQKGSMVAPDRLRFDFSHPKPVTAEELARVEDIANDIVLQNSPVTTRLMALDDARASGARALFGEKYGDEVRVVAMGEGSGNTLGWSVELCGGTHVKRTGDIGLITGLADCGVASGVRRLEALTGTAARRSVNKQLQTVKAVAAELKTPLEDMPARVAALLDERKKLERELADAKKKLAMGGGGGAANGAASDVRTVGDVKLMARVVTGIDIKDLKSLADEGKKQLGSGVVALVATSEDGKGRHRRRRHRRSDRALLGGRSGAQGLRSARRQRRRRQARHGAGRRPGRRQGRRGARRRSRRRSARERRRSSSSRCRRRQRGSRRVLALVHEAFGDADAAVRRAQRDRWPMSRRGSKAGPMLHRARQRRDWSAACTAR